MINQNKKSKTANINMVRVCLHLVLRAPLDIDSSSSSSNTKHILNCSNLKFKILNCSTPHPDSFQFHPILRRLNSYTVDFVFRQ